MRIQIILLIATCLFGQEAPIEAKINELIRLLKLQLESLPPKQTIEKEKKKEAQDIVKEIDVSSLQEKVDDKLKLVSEDIDKEKITLNVIQRLIQGKSKDDQVQKEANRLLAEENVELWLNLEQKRGGLQKTLKSLGVDLGEKGRDAQEFLLKSEQKVRGKLLADQIKREQLQQIEEARKLEKEIKTESVDLEIMPVEIEKTKQEDKKEKLEEKPQINIEQLIFPAPQIEKQLNKPLIKQQKLINRQEQRIQQAQQRLLQQKQRLQRIQEKQQQKLQKIQQLEVEFLGIPPEKDQEKDIDDKKQKEIQEKIEEIENEIEQEKQLEIPQVDVITEQEKSEEQIEQKQQDIQEQIIQEVFESIQVQKEEKVLSQRQMNILTNLRILVNQYLSNILKFANQPILEGEIPITREDLVKE